MKADAHLVLRYGLGCLDQAKAGNPCGVAHGWASADAVTYAAPMDCWVSLSVSLSAASPSRESPLAKLRVKVASKPLSTAARYWGPRKSLTGSASSTGPTNWKVNSPPAWVPSSPSNCT